MKIIVGVDGSKYGRWAAGWAARLPVSKPVRVTAVHALDLTYLKAPFMHQYVVIGNEPFLRAEVRRLVARSKRVVRETRGVAGLPPPRGEDGLRERLGSSGAPAARTPRRPDRGG
jgi:nucleotide-binding universal stress UspA family protein